MAKLQIEGGSQYQNVTPPTKQVTNRVVSGYENPRRMFFGIPFGPRKPIYSDVTTTVPNYTPTSSYGVNDTGRTTPGNPNPTMPDYQTTAGASGQSGEWAGGNPSQQGAGQGGSSAPANNPFGLLGLLFGGLGQRGGDYRGGFGGLFGQPAPYEAALRERPQDIQNLVSMTRRPGFGQGGGSGFGPQE